VKVLIAEDERVSCRLLETFLRKWGYEVVVAENGADAWKILQAEDAPRLALLDWIMPDMDGAELCRRVRRRVAQPYIYTLLLTAKDDKREVIEGLESGADDYLTKPFHPQELRARLRVGRRVLELEDNLVAAREVLQFKATHDPLTGLWNHSAILDVLGRELSRARRAAGSVGILLADLDHFKSINDAHGHLVGDEVLGEIARRMVASVRVYDSVGRYGGEEFLIIAPGCDASNTRASGERLRAAIAGQPVNTSEGPMRVTLSLGVVSSSAWREEDANALLRAADAVLYRAKNAGRNRVELAAPEKISVVLRNPSEDPLISKIG
jgi:diguanylate cyclase (GGDEF)-like protein